MRKAIQKFVPRASTLAVQAALLSLTIGAAWAADADADKAAAASAAPVVVAQSSDTAGAAPPAAQGTGDDAAAELTRRTRQVEIGIGDVNHSSWKFGEYNGLNKKDPFAVGNIDVSGGGAYDSGDATRWRLRGTDLGLDIRNINGEYGEQGKYRFTFGYDELLHNTSDTYQTPYSGAGTNTLTLPSNWVPPGIFNSSTAGAFTSNTFRGLIPGMATAPYINTKSGTPGYGTVVNPSAAQTNLINAAQSADLPDFQNVNLHTKRTAIDGGFSYAFDNNWDVMISGRTEKKDGLKALGALGLTGNMAAIIPQVIDQRTDQYTVAINYRRGRNYSQLAYNGSFYHDGVQQMNSQNPFTGTMYDISEPPSNQFHQLAFTGSYDVWSKTRLAVNATYGRNMQDASFINDGAATLPLGLPTSSLHGLVVTKGLTLKLTGQATDKLKLAGGFKYDDRDNRTPVNTYLFYDNGEAPSGGASGFNSALGLAPGTLQSNINIYNNRPYSKRLNEYSVDADYNFVKGQWLKAGLDYQQIDRYCTGTWIDCADASRTREETALLEWRTSVIENLNTRLGYSYAHRIVDYDENAFLSLVPMADVVPTGATQSVYQVMQQYGVGGFGYFGPYSPLAGNLQIFYPNNSALQQQWYGSRNDIQELPGMRRFNMANRDRNKARAAVDWQATERVNVFAGVDFNHDDYYSSAYGLQDAKSWAVNLDGTFTASENLIFNAYYSYENQRSRSAGDSYSAGALSNATFVGQAADTVVQGGCFSTVAAKNLNAKIDPCLNWNTDMRDRTDTLGVGFRDKGLMAGRLDLRGDFLLSYSKTDVGVNGGSYVNNPFALAAPAPAVPVATYFVPASALPTVSSNLLSVSMRGIYALDKQSSVGLMYRYQHLKSSDYAYDSMQTTNTIGNILPTNQQPPSYSVQVVSASYMYRF